MANKKVDMFKADKKFSTRVTEYMHARVWGIVYKKRLEVELAEYDRKLAIAREISEDEATSTILSKEDAERLAVKYAELKEQVENKYAKLVEENAKFEYTEYDKAFYKTYSADGDNRAKAVTDFCSAYKLEVKDTNMLEDIVSAIGGARKASAGQVVRSNATKFTDAKRTKSDVLNILYGRIAEYMLKAGTIKPEAIPEDIRAAFAPKKKEK